MTQRQRGIDEVNPTDLPSQWLNLAKKSPTASSGQQGLLR
jgi:hypothetical protein